MAFLLANLHHVDGTPPQIVGNIDMLPTFAKLVGTPLPADRVIDGRDITPLMFDPHAGPVRDTHKGIAASEATAVCQGASTNFAEAKIPTPAHERLDR